MVFLASIVALWFICWWFVTIDWTAVIAPSAATGALSYRQLIIYMMVVFALALLLPVTHSLAATNMSNLQFVTPPAGVLIGVTVFISVLITYQISRFTAVCYAFTGALTALQIYLKGTIDWNTNLRVLLSWITAPVLAAILSFIIYKVYFFILSKSKIHLLKLTFYQRFIVLFGVIFLALATGINNGAILVGLTDLVIPEGYGLESVLFPLIAIVTIVFIFSSKHKLSVIQLATHQFNINSQAVTSIVFATFIVLLLYSSDMICSAIGLKATPLAIPSLLLGGLVGLSLASKRRIIEKYTVSRSVISAILSPVMAVIVGYSLFFVFDIQNPKINNIAASLNANRIELDIYLMIIVIVAILVTLLILVILQQQKGKKMLERIAYSRQQQLNENMKSLNELEVKGVLIESQGLDTTLDMRREELMNTAYSISDQKEFLETIYGKISTLKQVETNKGRDKLIDEIQDDLHQKMSFSKELETFYQQAEILHKDFIVRVNDAFPTLTPQEKKLTILLRLGFASRYISVMMNISPKSVEIGRYRLRSKFNLKREDNLVKFIQSI